jgi:major membrane immunogen (membrane-anchored lipoprotein)
MRYLVQCLSLAFVSATLLSACGSRSAVPVSPQGAFNAPAANFQRFAAAPDLVAVTGLKAGDQLNVKGPFFTKGDGQVHAMSADAFKLEFKIATYHLRVEATRLNDKEVRFVTIDIKQNRTVEAVGTYVRQGNTTVFDMGKGQEVEMLTVKAGQPGSFDVDVVQAGRLLGAEMIDNEGKTTLRFSKK